MKRLLVLWFCLTTFVSAFYYLPYMDYKGGTFNLDFKYFEGEPLPSESSILSTSTDQQSKKLAYADLTFAFDQFALGVRVVPVRFSILTESIDITALAFNFLWRPDFLQFENFFNSGFQMGAYNIGISNQLEESVFRYDIQTSFLTYRMTPFSNLPMYNVYISSVTNFAEGDKYVTAVGMSWEYEYAALYVEKYYQRLLLSAKVNTSKYSTVGFMINPRAFSQRASQNDDEFVPTLALSLGFTGYFMKPLKVIKPVEIDDAAIAKMEEGLIAYYDQDYPKALDLYVSLIEDYPHFPLAQSRLGDIYYQLDMPEKALEHWRIAVKYDKKLYQVKRAIRQVEDELAKK